MQQNLDNSAAVATDTTTATDLGSAGFTHVQAAQNGQRLRESARYVVVTGAAAAPALDALLAKATPVAKFGSGSSATTVAEVQSAGKQALAHMRSADATARLAAARQLDLNSRLSVSGQVRPALDKGRLDLRAETVLALLTQAGPVTLDSAPQSHAERQAGTAIRTMVVTVGNVSHARATIAALPTQYRVKRVQQEPGSRLSIEFPVEGVPAMPVS